MNQAFMERYRCPEIYADFRLTGELAANPGFFRFGADTICYGKLASGIPAATHLGSSLHDASHHASLDQFTCLLPFDPSDVVNSLRYERYADAIHAIGENGNFHGWIRSAYYLMRPLLPVPVRRQLQRAALKGWDKLPFPNWPVDMTVERILERLLALSLKAHRTDKMPFIWFWPDGYSSCAILTHDVETSTGLYFCPTLADLDDSYGMKAAFQIIPQGRYAVPPEILQAVRGRGFEINVHDFNHDGRLYRSREEFLRRAAHINQHAKEFGARGFRSGALYRNLDWYDAFAFSYDMSVPNAGHLDPQPGGCCTVMPYFIGRILELPVTATQDYTLFHILGDHSIALWQRQIDLVREAHGLISFIIHPDYIIETQARKTYAALLAHLSQLRSEAHLWIALPGDVDRWWRQRSQMKLVQEDGRWRIEGPGKERAKIAWATLAGDRLSYTLEQNAEGKSACRC